MTISPIYFVISISKVTLGIGAQICMSSATFLARFGNGGLLPTVAQQIYRVCPLLIVFISNAIAHGLSL